MGDAGWVGGKRLRVALCVVFAVIVIKAASADLTWDEAWTFLHYGRDPLGFTRLDLANDHPLNSVLVWASTRLLGNSELIIRLPNVLAGGLYLAATARLVRGVRLKALAFAVCALQPYLIDYFSLARGYGLAVALVQCGLVAGFFAGTGRRRLATMLGCCVLASFAIFSTVVALYALIAAHLVDAWRHRRETGGAVSGLRVSLAFGALGLVPVAGLLWVSRAGVPLVGSDAGFFDAIPRAIAAMYVPDRWAVTVAILGLLALAAMLLSAVRHLGRRATVLLAASAICLAAAWLAAWVLGKPLPSGRVLLPWLPLFSLAVIASAEDLYAAAHLRGRRWIVAGTVPLCLLIGWSFAQHLHFQRFSDWAGDYRIQSRLAQSLVASKCLPPSVWASYAREYYLDRWFLPQYRPRDYPCLPP
jgi:hypothetical protein